MHFYSNFYQYNSIYDPEDFIDFINEKEVLSKDDYDFIINNLIATFFL